MNNRIIILIFPVFIALCGIPVSAVAQQSDPPKNEHYEKKKKEREKEAKKSKKEAEKRHEKIQDKKTRKRMKKNKKKVEKEMKKKNRASAIENPIRSSSIPRTFYA